MIQKKEELDWLKWSDSYSQGIPQVLLDQADQ